MKLSVIIPTYNEEKNIVPLIERVRQCGVKELEMIVVDDCSTDNTLQAVKSLLPAPDLKLVCHEKNGGKGAAVRTGQQHITGDIAVVQDADLEYDPEYFPQMMKLIEDGQADVVYGSRYLGGPRQIDGFWHAKVNNFLTAFFNLCGNICLTDVETCYKMAKAELFKNAKLKSNRFGFDPEITARFLKMKARFYEIPINYHPRRFDQGKKINWRDGFVVLWSTIKYNLLGR